MKKAAKKNAAKQAARNLNQRHQTVALCCAVFVMGMVGAAYAAVPLYDWFCRTTGFGGTPIVAKEAPAAPIARTINVRFDGNVAGGLPWHFAPDENPIRIHIGETKLFHYTAESFGWKESEGIASYNVSPPEAAGYFNKLQCFCFTNQKLTPGEKMDMPVVFFIDPAIDKDPQFRTLDTITLSYTFFPVKMPSEPVAAVGNGSQIR
jgi:cytochrome c oxidase assembly protein subunit 11